MNPNEILHDRLRRIANELSPCVSPSFGVEVEPYVALDTDGSILPQDAYAHQSGRRNRGTVGYRKIRRAD
jgi:hypothetical protein